MMSLYMLVCIMSVLEFHIRVEEERVLVVKVMVL